MRLVHFGKYAGMCTVKVDSKFYLLPTVIAFDSYYARHKKKDGSFLLERSTDSSTVRDFTEQDFYQLGKQLAKL